jgi:glycerol-3-phosphate responsive antiterminator
MNSCEQTIEKKGNGLGKIHQNIIPAVRRIADLDAIMKYGYEYAMMLQIHMAQLKHVVDMAHAHRVKLILHADLIQGLRSMQPDYIEVLSGIIPELIQ